MYLRSAIAIDGKASVGKTSRALVSSRVSLTRSGVSCPRRSLELLSLDRCALVVCACVWEQREVATDACRYHAHHTD